MNLVVKSPSLVEVGWLAETFGGGSLRGGQPGGELLDAGLVLCPELDVLGVLVALLLDLLLEVEDVLGDPVQLVLKVLGVLRNLVSCKTKVALTVSTNTINCSNKMLLAIFSYDKSGVMFIYFLHVRTHHAPSTYTMHQSTYITHQRTYNNH